MRSGRGSHDSVQQAAGRWRCTRLASAMAFASAAAVTQRVVEAQRLLVAPSHAMSATFRLAPPVGPCYGTGRAATFLFESAIQIEPARL